MENHPDESTIQPKEEHTALELSKLHGFRTLNTAATGGNELAQALKETANKIGDENGGVASDRRLKSDIRFREVTPSGLRLYDFRYAGDARSFTGVLAQDLLSDGNQSLAVTEMESGYFRVNYAALGLQHLVTPAMREAGAKALARAPALHS